jgi:hypothetical protein
MEYPGYSHGKIKLEEGFWYPFRVHKTVELQDGEVYFILSDVNGMKHFLETAPFAKYRIQAGTQLLCQVARINCTGRMYLEPQHPDIECGMSYLFSIISEDTEDEIQTLNIYLNTSEKIEFAISMHTYSKYLVQNAERVVINKFRKGIPEFDFK